MSVFGLAGELKQLTGESDKHQIRTEEGAAACDLEKGRTE